MYSQNDLDEAVAAGVISADAAGALRAHVDRQRASPAVDEEQFRLITGFNDIFVSIAAGILLFAVGFIGYWIGPKIDGGPSPTSGLLVAVTAWGLAEFFTARRRMALPSILLLLAFVGGTFFAGATSLALIAGDSLDNNTALAGMFGAASAALAAIAAAVHWRRFHVPITIAAGAAAAAGIVIGLIAAAIGDAPNSSTIVLSAVLLLGVGVFLFAMRWDASDPARLTRRSDVAFWLHLLAAPMIVHPVFTLLGLNDGNASVAEGVVVVALYIALGIAALAIDRRALLVSALAYVLFALNRLFETFGAVELNVALTALVIGSALLLLSAFWHQVRAAIVQRLPVTLQSRLPAIGGVVGLTPQPAA